MARSVAYSGATTPTVGQDTALATWRVPAGGASYVLTVDCRNLANDETLYAYFEREVRATLDARTEEWRIALSGHSGSGVVSTPMFGGGPNVELRVGINQEGGTGRAFPWAIERVDG